MGAIKEEKPRSSVMPLSWLCGFLSRAAVETMLHVLGFLDSGSLVWDSHREGRRKSLCFLNHHKP